MVHCASCGVLRGTVHWGCGCGGGVVPGDLNRGVDELTVKYE